MQKLPRRPREHILEEESLRFVKQNLPVEWIIEDGKADYGIDLSVEIVENNFVTGAHFLIQLKSTNNLKIRRGEYITHSCKTSTLQYFLQRPELIIYLVYDAKHKQGYWIWIQDYIRKNLARKLTAQKSPTIRIPIENIFDEKSIAKIQKRVLSSHEQAKWLTAIQTIQNPHVGYKVTIDNDQSAVQIGAYTKYPGALENHPVKISGRFIFDQSPEAQNAFQELEKAFKTGSSVTIDSRFLEGFDLTEFAPELFAHIGRFETKEITISTAQTNEGFVAKFSVLDENNRKLAELPYVDLRVLQAGSEVITYSNEHQAIPWKIQLSLNFKEQKSNFNIQGKIEGENVEQVRELLNFLESTTTGKWFLMTDLTTGTMIKEEIPKGIVSPEHNLVEWINDLAFIQEKTGQTIRWPGQITKIEVFFIKRLVQILQFGRIVEHPGVFPLGINKDLAIGFSKAFSESDSNSLRLDFSNYEVGLFGIKFELGNVSLIMPNTRLLESSRKILQNINQIQENQISELILNIGEPGAVLYFHKWLPKNIPS